jgi:putative FmdB family regulatory protein
MPTYEYRCKNCGHELEAVQSFTDDPLTECPRCEGPLRKKFGAVGISFKGSGFYKTDSRASSGGGPGGGDAKETAGASAGAGDGGGSSGGDGGSAGSSSTPASATSS